jgi:hypothetical protein
MKDRLKEALKPNAEGKYDGTEIVAAAIGGTRADAVALWESIKAQHARTEACELHQLLPTCEPRLKAQWRCGSCGWEPDAGKMLAYEQGLKHGRTHETGGGREPIEPATAGSESGR